MAKKKLNKRIIANLRAGVKRALEIPEGFDMWKWATESKEAPCGTAGCYAFEICAALGRFKPPTLLKKERKSGWLFGDGFISRYAEKLVGVPDGFLARTIFDPAKWPRKFRQQYNSAATPLARAEALRDAVENFIAKDGEW